MKKLYILFFVVVLTQLANSQENEVGPSIKITYKSMYKTWKELKSNQDIQILEINENKSVFYSQWARLKDYITDSLNKTGNIDNLERRKLIHKYRTGQSYEIMKDHIQNTLTYSGLIGSDALCYQDSMPKLEWSLSNQDSTILSYRCQAATAEWKGRKWKVWFTPDIPIADGPWKLCGLPGLILKATDSEQLFDFECFEISNTTSTIYPFYKSTNRKYTKCSSKQFHEAEKSYRIDPIGYIKRYSDNTVTIHSMQGNHKGYTKKEREDKYIEIEIITQ